MIKRSPRGINSHIKLRKNIRQHCQFISAHQKDHNNHSSPEVIPTTMASTNHHTDSGSRVHLRIHAWCERLYIRGVPANPQHEPLIIDIPQTWENCIKSKKKLKIFRLLALQTIMATKWGQPFHLPGARFQTKKVTIQYQNIQSGDTHDYLDLVNCRNNPSPRITTCGNTRTIHLWIRLTVIRIENWRKIVYASQQKSALRSKKKEQQTQDTVKRGTSDSTQPVTITLSPLQVLPISAFLQTHQSFSRLLLV